MNRIFVTAALAACLAAAPAKAVVAPFGGASNGVDPLGIAWSASGMHWGEPGYLAGTTTFNPGAISNNNGDFATSLSFTFLKGVGGTIDLTPSFTPFGAGPETRFTNTTDGVAWLVSYATGNVTFTAPTTAARLNPGDSFFVNVHFTGPIDPARFSFAGLWDDAVPEPASWLMMILGFGFTGGALRSSRRKEPVLF